MANKVTSILHTLRNAGYNPKFVDHDDSLVDNEIELSEKYSIQLCQDGCLGLGEHEEGEGTLHYPYVDSIEEVLEQIKQYEIVI